MIKRIFAFALVINMKKKIIEKIRCAKFKYEEKSLLVDEWLVGMTIGVCIIMIVAGRAVKHTFKDKLKRKKK